VRRPLRLQIMVPMVGIVLLTVAVVSALNAWLASARVRQQIEKQISDVSHTLSASNFPLESNVLLQMRGLTSADYVVVDIQGRAVAASDESLNLLAEKGGHSGTSTDLSAVSASDGRRFFHAVIPVDRQATGRGNVMLHVFYSEQALLEVQRQAVWPPLAIGGASIFLVAVVVSLIARRVTRPIQHLGEQVERIARGDFRAMSIPKREDEVQALAIAVNQMAQRLVQYEEQIRTGERTRAIGTLGGGIAHQIRNAATGCRIALDLHKRDYRSLTGNGHANEPLDVAVKQLAQIELSVQRLLALGKPPVAAAARTDLVAVTRDAVELVRPMISHMNVELTIALPEQPLFLLADSHSLTQLVVNLLVNAVEAAAHTRVDAGGQTVSGAPTIEIRLNATADCHFELAIGNSGPGPALAIQPRLFEPFATDKPGGTGLGLAVARRIAEDHAGSIRWEQRDRMTWFVVQFPAGV
jgi:signal transduction histidine kinase